MINNSLYKLSEIPALHPIVQKYEFKEFWRSVKRKCIEGEWVGGKWCPGELYYYINFHHIEFEDGIHRGVGLPWLRDIDWEEAYIYTEACGFSGFELDEENSCNRLLIDPNKEEILNFCMDRLTNKIDDKYYNNFFKKDGTYKTYVPARDYLRKIHAKGNLGKALFYNESKHIFEFGSRGFGKALTNSTLVNLYDGGSKEIKDLAVGEKILGNDGKPTKVTGIYPQGIRPVYEFTLSDGRTVQSDEEHYWGVYVGRKLYKTLTTKEIIDKGLKFPSGIGYRFSLPTIKPIEYQKKNLLVHPYILGAIMGDGNVTGYTLKIASSDDEVLDRFREILGEDYLLNKDKTNNNHYIAYTKSWENPLKRTLNYLGIVGGSFEKTIPDDYLYASIEQRMELLKGLLDTDGSINTDGSIEFSSSNETLAKQTLSLCRSLGIRSQLGVENRIGREHILPQGTLYTTKNLVYRVFIRTDLPVFHLSRKLNRIKSRKNKKDYVSIVSYKRVEDQECTCISIDNKSKLFLVEDYIPTHNTFGSSGRILHNFLFDGAKDYDEYLLRRKNSAPLNTETVVGAIDTKYSNKLINKVKTALNRLPGSSMIEMGGDIIKFPSPLSVNTEGSLAVGREFRSIETGSLIQHVTFADNPLAANGGRPNRIFIDEVGFANNLLEIWEAIESTQTAAEFRRLVIYALGTGGLTSGGAVTYAQEIFYDPKTYGCLEFEDVWEHRDRKIGFFVSGVFALNKFKEGPNLITNEAKALAQIEKDREDAKKSKSNTRILGTIINKPIKPSEIFLRAEGSFFPIQELKSVLSDLERNDILQKASYKVDLRMEQEGKVDIIPSDKKPITSYPLTRSDSMDACVEIFEKPKLDNNGIVYTNRYILGLDPIDDDGNSDVKRSLQSCFVLDTWTDRIVAEYTARTYLVDEYYENVRRLTYYYRGRLLYESNKKGLYAYFKNKNSLHLLAETPEVLKDQDLIKQSGIGNRSLGVNVGTDKIKIFGINLILKWLESPAYDKEGLKNIHTIRSQALLKELISYSLDVNADRVSALIVLFIFRSDIERNIDMSKKTSVKTATSDAFWGRAFSDFNSRKVHRNLLNLKNN